jgi:hypothetical protein
VQFSSTILLRDPRDQVGCIIMVVIIIGQRSHVRTAYYIIPPSSASSSERFQFFCLILNYISSFSKKTIIITLKLPFPAFGSDLPTYPFDAQRSLSLSLVPSYFPPPRLHTTTSYFTPTATTSCLSTLLLSTGLTPITLSNIEN